MGNRYSKNKTKCNNNESKQTPGNITPGHKVKQQTAGFTSRGISNNKDQRSGYNPNYNHVAVSTYIVDNNDSNKNKYDNDPCLWFKIVMKGKENTNEKMLIEGIYRKVQFIDTMQDKQTKGVEDIEYSMIIIESMKEYKKHYTSFKNVYVKIYNKESKELDQKKENVFLWHDGNKWIFSNYNTLYYYIDDKCGKKWVIKPETNNDNILISISGQYPSDLNILKQRTDIIFKNALNEDFKFVICNQYGKHYGHHQQQFVEDPSYRNAYVLWRDNLKIIYQRNQLFTMEQLKNEEEKCNDKMHAEDIKKTIDEINEICLSMEFRKLLKIYKDKSIKMDGWMNKGQINMMINDESYNEFYKIYIDNKTDKQLSSMELKDVVLQFHRYYYQLFNELNELHEFHQGQFTYK